MLAPDGYMHVAGIRWGFVNAFVENLDEPRFLFKHAKQVAHAFDVVEIRLRKNVGCAVDVNFPGRFLAFQTSLAQQHRVLE